MFDRRARTVLHTATFVLLWGSGAIASEIGLRHGSPLALLTFRYAIAATLLTAFAASQGAVLPLRGTLFRNAFIGVLNAGLYSTCYLLALDSGMTPGALATFLGAQPIVTYFITERGFSPRRLLGLSCALVGMTLIVSDGTMSFGWTGAIFASLALLGITASSILQKRERQAPWRVLPLQYMAGLIALVAMSRIGPFDASSDIGFVLPVLWMGVVISVGATNLLYLLISRGNLVNVTTLFYTVPAATVLLDWAALGDPPTLLMIAGVVMEIVGLCLVVGREKF